MVGLLSYTTQAEVPRTLSLSSSVASLACYPLLLLVGMFPTFISTLPRFRENWGILVNRLNEPSTGTSTGVVQREG